MSCTSKQPRCFHFHLPLPLAWGLALLLTAPATLSQTISPEDRLETIRQLLLALDQQALACQQSLDDSGTDQAGESCRDFLAAIDGDTVAEYLAQCQALKQWRQALIDSRQGAAPAQDDSLKLQRLMNIEVYCGENALLAGTEHVASSFAALQQALATTSDSGPGASRAWYQEYRRSQSSNTEAVNRRLRAETSELWRQLELENLRQQQNRPD